jgi:ribosomal protein S10
MLKIYTIKWSSLVDLALPFKGESVLLKVPSGTKYSIELSACLINYDSTCLQAGYQQIFNVYAFIFDKIRIFAINPLSKNSSVCFNRRRVSSKKYKIITVLRSPHVNKKSREQFFKRRFIMRATTLIFLRPQKYCQLRMTIESLQINFSKHRLSFFVLQFRSGEAFKYSLRRPPVFKPEF